MIGTLVVAVFMLPHAMGAEIGQIKTLTGDVQIIRQEVQRPASLGDLLEAADTVITGVDSSVGITFIDDSRFSIGPQSRVELQQFRFNPTTQEGEFRTEVKRGTVAIISGHIAKQAPDAMQVRTRTSILGVRGTTFLVKVEE
jgi:hypothetical protein